MKHTLLLVDDDQGLLSKLDQALQARGYAVVTAPNGERGIAAVKANPFLYSVIVLDHLMPPGKSGAQVAHELLALNNGLYIIVYSQHSKIPFSYGNVEFLEKGGDLEILFQSIQAWCNKFDERSRALSRTDLPDGNSTLIENENLLKKAGFVGRSPGLAKIVEIILREEKNNCADDVLITGESGTGKQVVAQSLHHHSPRRKGRFVTVDCGAIPVNLIESELFGHLGGSFTGATKDKKGQVEFANGGTIFLDEIGDASPELQVKLLRLLQEREIKPVGANDYKKVDVRVIAATNVDLLKAINEGKFRGDLYYRLNQVPLHLPPLRDRTEDIAPLIAHFTDQYNLKSNQNKRFLLSTVRKMELYSWPGNIRELSAKVRQYLKDCKGSKVVPDDIEGKFFAEPPTLSEQHKLLEFRYEQDERKFFERVRQSCASFRDAEGKTNISASTLVSHFKRLGISSKFEGKYNPKKSEKV